jgi:hypothetical protein
MPSTGNALKTSEYKNLDPHSKDAAIGESTENRSCRYALHEIFV